MRWTHTPAGPVTPAATGPGAAGSFSSIVAEKSDAFAGEVTAKTGENERVSVRQTLLNEQQTRIDNRVGTFGDKVVSQRILDETKKRL